MTSQDSITRRQRPREEIADEWMADQLYLAEWEHIEYPDKALMYSYYGEFPISREYLAFMIFSYQLNNMKG